MSIRVHCAACDRAFRARTSLIGTTKPCPGCEQPLRIGSTAAPKTYAVKSPASDILQEAQSTSVLQQAMYDASAVSRFDEPDQHVSESKTLADKKFWKVAIAIALGLIATISLFQQALTGPMFLMVAAGLLVAGVCLVFAARMHNWGESRVAGVSFFVFETVCVIRLVYGYSHGMEKFGFLFGMMLIGPLLAGMLCFGSPNDDGGGGWFFSSCSGCGSSCGGGCGSGCGGGCGGCGG